MSKEDVKKKEKDTNLSVKISSELLKKVRQKSAETGITTSFIIRKALEEWVKNEKDQTADSAF